MKVRWKRRSINAGSGDSMTIAGGSDTVWTATIGDKHVVVANLYGQSVALTGAMTATVFVWLAEKDGEPFGPNNSVREVNREYTVRDAKAWAVKQYSKEAV